MFDAFINAFKVPDLRKKILFTLFIIAIYRLGSHIPVAGIDVAAARSLAGINNGALGLLNLFSGGALTQLAVFALGIMPYITASIIMQLLAVVIPKLEEWQKEGEIGMKKITQWTRYMTVGLAVLQSTGLAFLFHNGGLTNSSGAPVDLIPHFTPARVALIVLTLTAGTALIMWLAELITTRGIGNGMSILIFVAIIASLPSESVGIYQQLGIGWSVLILLLGIGVIVAIVIVEQGQRRIPVQYAKRVVGRKLYGGSSTYIPLKVNQAGVIPIIFASSVLYFPALISTVVPAKWLTNFINNDLVNQASVVYIILYSLLIIFFTYFYTAITFNPVEVADNMKKYGGFIPGIRPGRATAEHLDYILTRITLPGSLFLAAVAILPSVAMGLLKVQNLPFGGVSILITVGVALETMKQIESQLMMRHYEGFLS
ncbi:MAG TPA: preprotein translocase subunit SecY [Actinomycetota bacterium]|nr:preprotein translocase subunit SecY [Actinomycetota bacterium]